MQAEMYIDEQGVLRIPREERPKVGVGVLCWRNSKLLLGKRKSAFGNGFYSLPGGHLEFSEKVLDCAAREVLEETNLVVSRLWKTGYTEDLIEGRHYITLYIHASQVDGELRLMEPDKCEGWDWYGLDELPNPLWEPVKEFLIEHFGVKF